MIEISNEKLALIKQKIKNKNGLVNCLIIMGIDADKDVIDRLSDIMFDKNGYVKKRLPKLSKPIMCNELKEDEVGQIVWCEYCRYIGHFKKVTGEKGEPELICPVCGMPLK